MSAKTTKLTFKSAYEDLEALTKEFERGDLDLEEALKKFECGLELAEYCTKQISEMKSRVVEIKRKFKQPLPDDGNDTIDNAV
ncbi:exodeoxyribonuclease VII small subunit [Candidatus Uhrbacteria bacterium]|nr:exodeoxyribonuclease VII small subunit [Candidatus Uhrbacteria bacterium]